MTGPERSPSDTASDLLRLLPALYRQRDAEAGGALEALLALLDERLLTPLTDDVAQLYDDAFIETCAPWVVPYLGDLLGVAPLHDLPGAVQRAYVANTIAYRRRKGTAAVVEQVARDVTGWPARAVEGFARLAVNQHLDHVRLDAVLAPDLRRADELELTGGPFEIVTRTVDVRHVATGRAGYNLPDLAVHQWRLAAYPLERTEPRRVDPGRYLLDPLGRELPAFRPGRTEDDITLLAGEADVPAPLRRRPLHDELERRRAQRAAGVPDEEVEATAVAFGVQPVFTVSVDGDVVEPERLHVCHLGTWRPPPAPDAGWAASVDPVLGRMVLRRTPEPAPDDDPPDVRVSWSYGFAGDLGGGPYDRRGGDQDDDRVATWQVGVARDAAARTGPDQPFRTMTEALAAWDEQPPGTVGVIVVLDSSSYPAPLTVTVAAGSALTIVAGDWPIEPDPNAPGLFRRVLGAVEPVGRRPVLGPVTVSAPAAGDAEPAALVLDGVAVDGAVTVTGGDLGRLRLAHCTLVPDRGELGVAAGNGRLRVELHRSVCGPVTLADVVPGLTVVDSIVDGPVAANGAALHMTAATVFGPVDCSQLAASSSIFTAPVVVARRQAHEPGDLACVRFSSVPLDGSVLPRRYRCQPDLALTAATPPGGTLDADQRRRVIASVRPVFTSRSFAHPAYGQLARSCPDAITGGGEDETNMGAFSFLRDPWRMADAARATADYVRFGIETGFAHPT